MSVMPATAFTRIRESSGESSFAHAFEQALMHAPHCTHRSRYVFSSFTVNTPLKN